jgi:hypothetical protein
MKTEKAMKTENSRRVSETLRGNNVQKAFLRTIAVIISFVLISYTVSAQEFWKKLLTNSSFNEIAIAMTKTPAKTASSTTITNSSEFYLEEATEPAMELENWMTNENTFRIFNFNLENEVEIPMAIESWMLDANTFENNNLQEETLDLENWMTSTEVWGV